ncbi:MAG: type II toxin-antitoxin system VapC family toxin, partial [Anaerolineales bacterium]|nr:type II toxin-antitoxin system VapC family toxin [Anaerolineales bacterium]
MIIIDASVILSALFPDEQQQQSQAIIRDHAAEQISLVAPTLLQYELTNAVWQGVRRQRITMQQAQETMTIVDELRIPLEPVSWENSLNWA